MIRTIGLSLFLCYLLSSHHTICNKVIKRVINKHHTPKLSPSMYLDNAEPKEPCLQK